MNTKRAMILVSNDPESVRLGANEIVQHLNEVTGCLRFTG